jgi:peptidoglycan/xylan/chitin deacetylase (PgdA/CDA1 family)
MLNYRNTSILLLISYVAMFIAWNVQAFSFYYFFIPSIIYLLLLFYGSFFVCSNFYVKAICKGNTSDKKISLSFDDGPDKNTSEILDILQKYNVKATFFIIGSKIEQEKKVLKRMHKEGHIIGNHTWSHANHFDLFPAKKVEAELRKTNIEINKLTQQNTSYFRPPYGVTNPAIGKAVKNTGMKAIGWNIRSLDTKSKDSLDKIFQRITSKINPGSIVLLHDYSQHIKELLPKVIEYAQGNGYQIVPLNQLIQDE